MSAYFEMGLHADVSGAAKLPLMKEKIAQTLFLRSDQVNVKATTEEKLGFTGREEGISAHAVCIMMRYL